MPWYWCLGFIRGSGLLRACLPIALGAMGAVALAGCDGKQIPAIGPAYEIVVLAPAGKSVLARAVARGAGVEGPIPSPTFNLMFE